MKEITVNVPLERFKELEEIEQAFKSNVVYVGENPHWYILGLDKQGQSLVKEIDSFQSKNKKLEQDSRELDRKVKVLESDVERYKQMAIDWHERYIRKKWHQCF